MIDPENGASACVEEKVGMRLEREVVRPGGTRRHVYALDRTPGQGMVVQTS